MGYFPYKLVQDWFQQQDQGLSFVLFGFEDWVFWKICVWKWLLLLVLEKLGDSLEVEKFHAFLFVEDFWDDFGKNVCKINDFRLKIAQT